MTNTTDPIGSLHVVPATSLRDLLVAAKKTGQTIVIFTVIDPDGIDCTVTAVGSGSDPVITASRTVGGRTATFWFPLHQIVYVNQLNTDATVPVTPIVPN